ncbi:hypothetical protein AAY473_011720, partial [Plecturocebus cupreus]
MISAHCNLCLPGSMIDLPQPPEVLGLQEVELKLKRSLPIAHLLLFGPVPNRPWTGTSLRTPDLSKVLHNGLIMEMEHPTVGKISIPATEHQGKEEPQCHVRCWYTAGQPFCLHLTDQTETTGMNHHYHTWLISVFLVEMGFNHVGQADLKFLTSGYPFTSASQN